MFCLQNGLNNQEIMWLRTLNVKYTKDLSPEGSYPPTWKTIILNSLKFTENHIMVIDYGIELSDQNFKQAPLTCLLLENYKLTWPKQ